MCKLKAKKKEFEVEIAYIIGVGSVNTFNSYLLLLVNSFNFNLSFLILPDVISNNIPILFFIEYLSSPLVPI